MFSLEIVSVYNDNELIHEGLLNDFLKDNKDSSELIEFIMNNKDEKEFTYVCVNGEEWRFSFIN